jgi:hypothetical protein
MWGRGESGNIKITSRIYREICAVSMRGSDGHTGCRERRRKKEYDKRNCSKGNVG